MDSLLHSSSSSSSITSLTSGSNKENRLYAIKKKIAAVNGIDIIKLPSLSIPMEIICHEDSPEEKQRKKDFNTNLSQQRIEEYQSNEHLIIQELEKLASKVRETILEVGGVDKKYGFGTRPEREFKFVCSKCGNNVS